MSPHEILGDPAFFCNFFNGDLYIDALITELFQICLVEGEVRELVQPGGSKTGLP